jgi:hypothetical protein
MIIARWESKSGKYWVELTRGESGGVFYNAPGATGSLGMALTDEEALADMQARVDSGYFLPDTHKTPMKKVA